MDIAGAYAPSVFTSLSSRMCDFIDAEKRRSEEGVALQSGLYAHQVDAVAAVKAHFDPAVGGLGTRTALVVLPTGCGKSGVAVLSAYVTNKARVLVITPSVKVSKQLAKDFGATQGKSFLYKYGVVPPETPEPFVLPTTHVVESDDLVDVTKRGRVLLNQVVIANVHKAGPHGRLNLDDIPKGFDLVIVDEAHHYPAPTWRRFIDYFDNASRLFITGTPRTRKNRDILENQAACLAFNLPRDDAIARSIIRQLEFDEATDVPDSEAPSLDDQESAAFLDMSRRIYRHVRDHDDRDPDVMHQAMVLSQTVGMINSAELFVGAYNTMLSEEHGITDPREQARLFVGGHSLDTVKEFEGEMGDAKKFRVLVVVGRLLEGFDHAPVSVVGVARNVKSRILFEQFVGRAVRRTGDGDVGTAVIVSHTRFKQRSNFDLVDTITEDDAEQPIEEDD